LKKGFYTLEEVQAKLGEYRQAVARAESEIRSFNKQATNRSLSAIKTELLQHELETLHDRNLMESTFEDRTDFIAKFGIGVLSSGDLKSREIFC
jgi:phosphoenolpyruvate-protein kinase (PTS system EI component)